MKRLQVVCICNKLSELFSKLWKTWENAWHGFVNGLFAFLFRLVQVEDDVVTMKPAKVIRAGAVVTSTTTTTITTTITTTASIDCHDFQQWNRCNYFGRNNWLWGRDKLGWRRHWPVVGVHWDTRDGELFMFLFSLRNVVILSWFDICPFVCHVTLFVPILQSGASPMMTSTPIRPPMVPLMRPPMRSGASPMMTSTPIRPPMRPPMRLPIRASTIRPRILVCNSNKTFVVLFVLWPWNVA